MQNATENCKLLSAVLFKLVHSNSPFVLLLYHKVSIQPTLKCHLAQINREVPTAFQKLPIRCQLDSRKFYSTTWKLFVLRFVSQLHTTGCFVTSFASLENSFTMMVWENNMRAPMSNAYSILFRVFYAFKPGLSIATLLFYAYIVRFCSSLDKLLQTLSID